MGLIKKIEKIIWQLNPKKKPGRPGEMKHGNFVFCPITNKWITYIYEHLPISGNRTFYDELDLPNPNNLNQSAADFHLAAQKSGFRFPEDLKTVVITCEFCDAYCIGKENAPLIIPKIESIDRKKLLFDLRGVSEKRGRATVNRFEVN